jgi:hypothetical protein
MGTRFQPLKDTHITSIRVQNHILLSKEIPGVNPVLQQKQEKDFVFHLTAGFPDPSERWVSVSVSNQEFISFGRREEVSPREGPEVRA